MTAVVGHGAGALGVVLGDDEVFSSSGTELTSSPVYLPDDLVDSRRLGGIGAPSANEVVTPGDEPVGASTSTIAIRRSTTTTTSLASDTVTTPPTTATTPPLVAVATTPTGTTATPEAPPSATDPAATTAPAPPPEEVPVTAAPGPAPVAPTPAPTPASPGFVFYLSSPGSGDVSSQPVLLLSLDPPPCWPGSELRHRSRQRSRVVAQARLGIGERATFPQGPPGARGAPGCGPGRPVRDREEQQRSVHARRRASELPWYRPPSRVRPSDFATSTGVQASCR